VHLEYETLVDGVVTSYYVIKVSLLNVVQGDDGRDLIIAFTNKVGGTWLRVNNVKSVKLMHPNGEMQRYWRPKLV
jgi:hypothetical protein